MALFVLLACSLRPAPAQAGEWEAWGGYSSMRDTTDRVTFPTGWDAGALRSLTTWLSVVGELDGQRKSIPSFASNIVLTSRALTLGARASARLGRVTEFAQVCGGVLRSDGDAFGQTSTSTSYIVQPGLGLDYPLGRRWAARIEADVRWIDTGQQLRGVVALVYRRR
jgi:hypothetical protein